MEIMLKKMNFCIIIIHYLDAYQDIYNIWAKLM